MVVEVPHLSGGSLGCIWEAYRMVWYPGDLRVQGKDLVTVRCMWDSRLGLNPALASLSTLDIFEHRQNVKFIRTGHSCLFHLFIVCYIPST